LRRASELLADVLHEVQRRLALEGASAAKVPTQRQKSRAKPMPYVDLATYDGMADRDLLLALGARQGEISYYKPALQREQARRIAFRVDDAGRCQAGIAAQLGLRCTRTALAGERCVDGTIPIPPQALRAPRTVVASGSGESPFGNARMGVSWRLFTI
jgi:hypothetical protein